MPEISKMIGISKNGKNDGNSQKWKILEISKNSINAGISQKLYLLGGFPVMGWIPVPNKF